MRYAVLGAGLIGSAAARHLAMGGHDVTLFGPDEPPASTPWSVHGGVFGSHYDEGRITRRLDGSPFWSEVSERSIQRYGEIEAQSGISFFRELGGIMAAADLTNVRETAAARGVTYERITPAVAAEHGYHLPMSVTALFERTQAGHISPRRLVAAQQAAAMKMGAQRLRETVRETQGATVSTDRGTHPFDAVLWAAGGFGTPHLTLPLTVQARTVCYFEVSEEDASDCPTLILEDGKLIDIYLLPPIRYPDGRHYWKIGGGPKTRPLRTEAEMRAWFQSGGDAGEGKALSAIFHTLVPGAKVRSEHIAPCVTTYTPDELPAIGRLRDGVCVATAGNGRGAKCSDELGRLGAMALLGDMDPRLDPARFS